MRIIEVKWQMSEKSRNCWLSWWLWRGGIDDGCGGGGMILLPHHIFVFVLVLTFAFDFFSLGWGSLRACLCLSFFRWLRICICICVWFLSIYVEFESSILSVCPSCLSCKAPFGPFVCSYYHQHQNYILKFIGTIIIIVIPPPSPWVDWWLTNWIQGWFKSFGQTESFPLASY